MLNLLSRVILRTIRWRIDGELPALDKYVIIGAPHTSTWDAVVFLSALPYLGLRLRFLSKPENLRGLRGPIFRYFGAIAVDRSNARNVVADIAAEFAADDHFILALGPEGTRKGRSHWRSGFYHIARAAHVPVLMVAIHFKERRIVLGPTIDLTGDIRADMDQIREFYRDNSSGADASRVSPVRLREEDEIEAEG
jgi:1-acyl-sn-glycerol-3-phosphate acyltransferase